MGAPDIRKRILGKRIYIGYTCVNAKDYLVVPKCMKCQDLGHVAKHCMKTDSVCNHCEEKHDRKECKEIDKPKVCISCKLRNKRCSKDAKDCPTHKLLMERLIQKTDYGQ